MTTGMTRKKVRSHIATLKLPRHYDLATLVRRVEAVIGHTIEIRERDDVGNATATGGLRKEGNGRVILLVRHCSPRTRVMTILHELGHLICGHERVFIRQVEAAGVLEEFVQCDRATLHSHMGWRYGGPQTEEEVEAEVAADELSQGLIDPTADPLRKWLGL